MDRKGRDGDEGMMGREGAREEEDEVRFGPYRGWHMAWRWICLN